MGQSRACPHREGLGPPVRTSPLVIQRHVLSAEALGIFLKVDRDYSSHFRVTLGPQVQTLTKAMTSVLCNGLEGVTPQELLDVPSDFVPKIVGADLVRQRSQTVYYILTRMKSAAKVWLNRQRALNADASA
jgi:cysteine desulfuration protein SufE